MLLKWNVLMVCILLSCMHVVMSVQGNENQGAETELELQESQSNTEVVPLPNNSVALNQSTSTPIGLERTARDNSSLIENDTKCEQRTNCSDREKGALDNEVSWHIISCATIYSGTCQYSNNCYVDGHCPNCFSYSSSHVCCLYGHWDSSGLHCYA